MEHRDNHIRLQSLRRIHRVQNRRLVDFIEIGRVVLIEHVHRVFLALRKRQIVEPLRISDERDFHAVDVFEQHPTKARLVILRRVRSHVGNPRRVEILDRASEAGKPILNGIRVCRLQNVKADRVERLGQRLRRAEIGLSGIRFAAEVELQIPDRQIRRHCASRDGGKARGEIVRAVTLQRGLQLFVIHHDIAHGRNRHGRIRLGWNGRLRYIRLRRILRCLLRLLRFFAGAATAHDQNQR